MLQIRVCEYIDVVGVMREAVLTFLRFVKILVIEIFSSVLGLFGLIIGLLLSSAANDFE